MIHADYIRRYETPLGGITLSSDGESLTGLRFDSPDPPAEGTEDPQKEKDLPVFADARRWLDLYFSGRDPGFVPKLNPRGTVFRRTVWEILLTVPYGETITYGAVAERAAERLGVPRMSAQAVGGAAGHNPVALIIPCHRIVGADGSLTGYAGGIERKAALLETEERVSASLSVRPNRARSGGKGAGSAWEGFCRRGSAGR